MPTLEAPAPTTPDAGGEISGGFTPDDLAFLSALEQGTYIEETPLAADFGAAINPDTPGLGAEQPTVGPLEPEVNTLPSDIVENSPTIAEMVAQLDRGEDISLTAFDLNFLDRHNIVASSVGDVASAAFFFEQQDAARKHFDLLNKEKSDDDQTSETTPATRALAHKAARRAERDRN